MEAILNRLRGTGDIFNIFGFSVTGANIYAVYLGLLFGLSTCSLIIGIFTSIGFIAGESFGWGKWVGSLCYPERYTEQTKMNPEYLDKEGHGFPYIHHIANFIQPESKNYMQYCNIALGLRGAVWAAFLYLGITFGVDIVNCVIYLLNLTWLSFEYISAIQIPILSYLFAIIAYGIGFPLSCYIANLPQLGGEYEKIYQNKFIAITGKWEKQEVIYGFIHMLVNMYLVYTIIN